MLSGKCKLTVHSIIVLAPTYQPGEKYSYQYHYYSFVNTVLLAIQHIDRGGNLCYRFQVQCISRRVCYRGHRHQNRMEGRLQWLNQHFQEPRLFCSIQGYSYQKYTLPACIVGF